MALVKCKNCGKEISDRATACPTCGTPINKPENQRCTECGFILSSKDNICPNCGCPIQSNELPQKIEIPNVQPTKRESKRKKPLIIVAVILIFAIIASAISFTYYKKQKTIEDYQSNLSLATSTMLNSAVKAEDAGNLIHDVWYNTIYEKSDSRTNKYTHSSGYGFNSDFNTSLNALFSDEEFSSQIDDINESKDLVNSLMKSLSNPPKQYAEAYAAIKELYDAYLDITNCATNPTGSLTTFSSTFNDADSNFSKAYDAMKVYM